MKLLLALALLLGGFVVTAQPGSPPQRAAMMMPETVIKSELDFIRAMIPHHQEAIDSAATIAKNSEHPQLRAFARSVIRVQARETKTMRSWLRAWYPNRAEASRYTPMMRHLPNAAPNEVDRAFAEDMVAHHEMALNMAEQFLASDFAKHPKVEALAKNIIATQSAEITTLRGWLQNGYGDASTN